MRLAFAAAMAVFTTVLIHPAAAAPRCEGADSQPLCLLAEETQSDNPSFAQMREGGPQAEQARMQRQAERRTQTRSLLDEISSPTWRDLYRAGYVIAYGNTPEEDLLAWAISIRALSLAPDEADVRFLVAMTSDEIGRRYVGAQLYGRQKWFTFDQSGRVDVACLPQMIDPPLPPSIGATFHTPGDGFERCPDGVGPPPDR